MAPIPERIAVLCRQLPTAIQRAVSSPSLDGSTTIILHPASKARSNSSSNVSCALSVSYTSRMMATLEGSNSLFKEKSVSVCVNYYFIINVPTAAIIQKIVTISTTACAI
jgi:hypothetical protein